MVRQTQKSKNLNFRIFERDRSQILGTCIDRKNPKFYGIRSSGSGDTTVFVPLVFQQKLKNLQFLRFLLIKISTWAHVWACAQSSARGQPKFLSYFNFIWGYLKNATMHLNCPLAGAEYHALFKNFLAFCYIKSRPENTFGLVPRLCQTGIVRYC